MKILLSSGNHITCLDEGEKFEFTFCSDGYSVGIYYYNNSNPPTSMDDLIQFIRVEGTWSELCLKLKNDLIRTIISMLFYRGINYNKKRFPNKQLVILNEGNNRGLSTIKIRDEELYINGYKIL